MSDKKVPIRKGSGDTPATRQTSNAGEVAEFLRRAKAMSTFSGAASGRLVLALDATMSRQPTWDLACTLQAEMFDAAGGTGKLEVQLVYFRGFGECRSSRFVTDTGALKDLMVKIDCRGGQTQIRKVLSHTLAETQKQRVSALVYIGDAMEEDVDQLADKAGRLGMHGVPVFVFQEGRDTGAEAAFKEIARLSKGAWFRFDQASAATLKRLLSSVAVYATGGFKALENRGTAEDRLMIENMRGG